jgi:type II secretory pathway component PulK
MLEGLFSCPAEKAFLEQKKVTPRELAYRIKDYIDFKTDADENSGFNDEDEPYSRREPKQRAKNAPLDSLEEMRQIEGWDEEIHAVFGPYVTIWPFQADQDKRTFMPINVNTASRSLLQCLFPESRGDCQEKVALFFKKRAAESLAVGGEGKKMIDVLRETLCYTGGEGTTDRASWFSQMSNVFRIETLGTVGDAQKRLTAVIERGMPDQKKNEKGSNKLLYWKLN